MDLSHARFADVRGDVVNAKAGAGCKCQWDATIRAGAECGRD